MFSILLMAMLTGQTPSLLDRLDRAKIAEDERPAGSPQELVAVLRGHRRSVSALAFSPDGKLLASAGWDNTVRVWRFGKDVTHLEASLEGSPSGLAFSPDGKTLVTGSPGTSVRLWDVTHEPPKMIRTLPGHKNRPFAVAFAPSGKLMVTGCNEPVLRLWKLGGDEPEAWGVLANETVPSLGIASLAIDRDSKWLAAGGMAGKRTLRLWKLAGDFLEEVDIPAERARYVAFCPTDELLAFAGDEAGIKLWSVKSGETTFLRTIAVKEHALGFVFAADGRSLAVCAKKKVSVWEVSTGKPLHECVMPDEVRALAFAPDGRHLAVGAADGIVCILRLRPPGASR